MTASQRVSNVLNRRGIEATSKGMPIRILPMSLAANLLKMVVTETALESFSRPIFSAFFAAEVAATEGDTFDFQGTTHQIVGVFPLYSGGEHIADAVLAVRN